MRPCRLTCRPDFAFLSLSFSSWLACLALVLPPSAAGAGGATPGGLPRLEALGGPLRFEANRGQADPSVRFLSRGPGYGILLGPDGVRLSLGVARAGARDGDRPALHLVFEGSPPAPVVEGLSELPTRVHYYLGSDPAAWRTGIPTYARVRYAEVYPGIDVVLYGHEGELEYDIVVAPGADPGLFRMSVRGAERLERDASGDLLLHAAREVVRMRRPFVYQERDGHREPVAAEYALVTTEATRPATQVAFRLAAHDPNRPLVIDPVVVYSTYVPGAADESAHYLARGTDGSVSLVGQASLSWPYTPPPGYGGLIDAWVARLDPGGAPVYFAYLGGSDYESNMTGALDASGNLIVVGTTASRNFPTLNAVQPQNGYQGYWATTDAFATKLDPSGALVYSTYLGGRWSDAASRVSVDAAGDAYLCGYASSAEFPTTPDAIQPTLPGPENGLQAFLTRLGPTGTLVYSTFLGGTQGSSCADLAVDGLGGVYLAGSTQSVSDFPLVNPLPASPANPPGNGDVFVAKLDVTQTPPRLVYSTLLGGSSRDHPSGIAVDGAGGAVVVGSTEGPGFPLVNAAQPHGGSTDAFAAKIAFDPATSATSLVFSTYLGGSGRESIGRDFALDAEGNAYVVGATASADFPTRNAAQAAFAGVDDGFVVKLDPAGDVAYATYLGGGGQDAILGVEADASGNAHLVGAAYPYWPAPGAAAPFPQVEPVQPVSPASQNGFVTKLNRAGGILYSSYLGGSHSDYAAGLALDAAGNAYVSGYTLSSDFPTVNPAQGSLTGQGDGFVVKIHDANRPPSASAGQPPYDVAEGGAVGLTASGTDPEAGPLTYDWDLDGDGVFETPGASVSFDAADMDGPGTRTVGVQVTDEEGLQATAEATVAAFNVAPSASFTASPPAPIVGECVTLALAGASDPAPADETALVFSFDCAGDGFDRSGPQTSHLCSYAAPGPVTAVGRVADDDGGSADYTVSLQVRTPQATLEEAVLAEINDLVATGTLTPAQANGLLAVANAAMRHLDRGNLNAAIATLGALTNLVDSLVRRDILPPDVGQGLVDAANQIIEVLQRWQAGGGTCP